MNGFYGLLGEKLEHSFSPVISDMVLGNGGASRAVERYILDNGAAL